MSVPAVRATLAICATLAAFTLTPVPGSAAAAPRAKPPAKAPAAVEARVRRALQSAQKYSLVANSVKSEVTIEPEILVQ